MSQIMQNDRASSPSFHLQSARSKSHSNLFDIPDPGSPREAHLPPLFRRGGFYAGGQRRGSALSDTVDSLYDRSSGSECEDDDEEEEPEHYKTPRIDGWEPNLVRRPTSSMSTSRLPIHMSSASRPASRCGSPRLAPLAFSPTMRQELGGSASPSGRMISPIAEVLLNSPTSPRPPTPGANGLAEAAMATFRAHQSAGLTAPASARVHHFDQLTLDIDSPTPGNSPTRRPPPVSSLPSHNPIPPLRSPIPADLMSPLLLSPAVGLRRSPTQHEGSPAATYQSDSRDSPTSSPTVLSGRVSGLDNFPSLRNSLPSPSGDDSDCSPTTRRACSRAADHSPSNGEMLPVYGRQKHEFPRHKCLPAIGSPSSTSTGSQ